MKFVKLYDAILTVVLLIVGNSAFAQDVYVKTDIIKVPGVTADQISTLPATSKTTSFVYLNGLGVPAQKVGYQQSPNANDIVQIYQYDQYGQLATSYLPYVDNTGQNPGGSFRGSALIDQQNYYIINSTPGNLNKVANDPFPFSQELFENSPLHRLIAIGSNGIGFQPDLQDNSQHFSVITYRNNTAADKVMISPTTDGTTFYPANTLSVIDAKDADGIETLVFTNSMGQKLLKRQVSGNADEPYYDTYHVFNANGSLAFIIPPKATNLIALGSSTNIASAPLSNLIYAYTYDALGRTITRQAPNTGVISIIYDPMNRPVLVQDGNQALSTANQWSYIKYDTKGRPVSQGVYTDNTNKGQANMQKYVNDNYGANFYESRSPASATMYYTNNCFPSQNIQPLGFAFYDDYDLTQPGSPYYRYQAQGLVDLNGTGIEAAPVTLPLGMLTMVLKRTVGSGLNDIWLSNVNFYDKHGNIIQVQTNNHLNFTPYAVTDYRTVAPDFMGKPLQVKTSKVTGSGAANTNAVITSLTYDPLYRPLTLTQQYNNQSATVLATYAYNEIGQLVTKNLGPLTSGNIQQNISSGTYGATTLVASNSISLTAGYTVPIGSTLRAIIASSDNLQTLDYRYNIRNQLLTINNSGLTNDGGITNGDNTDLFGMTYIYDGGDPSLANASPSHSGKISAVKWSYKYNNGASTSNERSYVYKYDQLGQLNSALYAERAPGSSSTIPFNVNPGGFDETGITYDDDGNITALKRNYSGNNGAGGTALDNLSYYPDAIYPDRLSQVSDAVTQTSAYGFNNVAGATSSSTYQYDADGNLTADPYKGISITYNLINRTDVITLPNISSSTVNYTYDGSKAVLKKQIFKGGSLQATTDYIDEFVYVNGVISYLSMPEGRVVNASGVLKPEYVISDQQGNARFSFQDNGSGSPVIIQENSYYGFGAVMPNSLVAASPNTNSTNLYNGQSEWENDLQNLPDYYQTGSRNYDPELGRFISVDPMAELSASLTNYHYAGNNPIMGNDPTGNCDPDVDQGCPLYPEPPAVIIPPEEVPDIQEGGGGGGDPGTDYSGNSVPSTPTSYGGSYNNGDSNLPSQSDSTNPDGTPATSGQGTSGSVSNGDPGQVKWVPNEGVDANGNSATVPQLSEVQISASPLNSGDNQGDGGTSGMPTLEDLKREPPKDPGYIPPKSGARKGNSSRGRGWVDNKGNVWVPNTNDGKHAPHWDVQPPKGPGYTNVYPDPANYPSDEAPTNNYVAPGNGIKISPVIVVGTGMGVGSIFATYWWLGLFAL